MAYAEKADDLRDRPLGDLVGRLSDETAELIREEIALAKLEMSEKGRVAGRAGVYLGAGGLFGFLGLAAVTTAIVAALSLVMATWLAAAIVGVVYLLAAGVGFLIGRRILKQAGSPLPEQTVETLKEDVRWLSQRSRSGTT
jgi:hypothetical protein